MGEDKFLSSDVWKSWERHGKSEFFMKCKGVVKAQDTSSPIFSSSENPEGLTRAVYELIWHGMRGVIRKEATVLALEELLALHCDISSMILDVIAVIDAETFSNDGISEERLRFNNIVKDSEKFLTDKLYKERLEIETLQSVGTLKNKSYYTKFIKVKTKLYYKQRKFNLFREESEGYAKLVVELNQEITPSIKPSDILEAIKSLIGCFNLDPNRVLDVILESFECRPEHHAFFIPLIQSYMPDPKILCEVLGFKFSFYQGGVERPPESLYIVTALMLQYDIISLDDIHCWLTPDDKSIQKDWEKEISDAKEYARKLSIISIKDKDKDKDEAPEEKENIHEKYYSNQKFGLCEALLKVGDWDHTQKLSQKLPEHCLMEQPPIARATCQLLHVVIDPVYKKLCTLSPKIQGRNVTPLKNSLAVPAVDTLLGLRQNAIPMLQALGPSLHMDPALMYKILRICKVALSEAGAESGKPPPQNKDTLYYDVITILDEVIFPSLSYMDSNCCLAEEVWTVVKYYPYQTRYCLYTRWKNDTYQHHAKLIVKKADAQKKIKGIMKRVSKENVKQSGRHIGKLTHSSPGFLFDYMAFTYKEDFEACKHGSKAPKYLEGKPSGRKPSSI